jgi:hypothetical protein
MHFERKLSNHTAVDHELYDEWAAYRHDTLDQFMLARRLQHPRDERECGEGPEASSNEPDKRAAVHGRGSPAPRVKRRA